jgi:hypothetical protein
MLEHMTDFRSGALVPCFETIETVMHTIDSLVVRNEGKAVLDLRHLATRAALGLFGKSRKCADAVYLTSRYGYGQDAMILSRSLVNICIDLKFVCGDREASEARARTWMARGKVGRRAFASRVGAVPPDESRVDWVQEGKLAKEWEAKNIYQRAEITGLLNFYNLPYRHGSVFEHSDSWGALAFVDFDATEARILPDPSEHFVDLALLSASCALAQVGEDFGRYYDFEFAGAIGEMEAAVRKGFPVDVYDVYSPKPKDGVHG